jgi:hypothetical protein
MAPVWGSSVRWRARVPHSPRWGLLLGMLLVLGVEPVFANYEWCSKDPVLTFQRQGALTVYILDVQVQVPLAGRAPQEPATLTVTLPANVGYHAVDTSTPVFPLTTVFDPSWAPVTTDAYGVALAAAVPGSYGAVPLRLVITNPAGGLPMTCESAAGQAVRAAVQFAPFAVACQ